MTKNQEFHKDIEHLYNEIDRIDPSNDKERKVIERLRNDLKELVEISSQNLEIHDESVIDRLYDSVERFEVVYPELTKAVKKVLDILSASGI